MLSQTLFTLSSLALLGSALPASGSLAPSPRAAEICFDSETPQLHCYNGDNDVPQNVSVADVTFIASYLRAYGAQTRAGRLFTMSATDAADCAEWTLFMHGSAIATAKHIDTTTNSSVLSADIANTIDGGLKATPAQQAGALLGCGTSGGSYGIQANASNPAYKASTYPAGFKPEGILIKIVASGA